MKNITGHLVDFARVAYRPVSDAIEAWKLLDEEGQDRIPEILYNIQFGAPIRNRKVKIDESVKVKMLGDKFFPLLTTEYDDVYDEYLRYKDLFKKLPLSSQARMLLSLELLNEANEYIDVEDAFEKVVKDPFELVNIVKDNPAFSSVDVARARWITNRINYFVGNKWMTRAKTIDVLSAIKDVIDGNVDVYREDELVIAIGCCIYIVVDIDGSMTQYTTGSSVISWETMREIENRI